MFSTNLAIHLLLHGCLFSNLSSHHWFSYNSGTLTVLTTARAGTIYWKHNFGYLFQWRFQHGGSKEYSMFQIMCRQYLPLCPLHFWRSRWGTMPGTQIVRAGLPGRLRRQNLQSTYSIRNSSNLSLTFSDSAWAQTTDYVQAIWILIRDPKPLPLEQDFAEQATW